jgi:hypothetical protein
MKKIHKPTKEFFDTLGQYVYCYRGPDGEMKPLRIGEENYVGKGVGDRCLHHIKDKGYSMDDCFIVACNLEKFNLDKKDASFVLESFLISTFSPKDNSVSGHYKECFVMSSLSFLFENYQRGQRDMFKELHELVSSNPEVFDGKIAFSESRDTTYYIETDNKNTLQTYLGIQVKTTDPQISVKMKTNSDKIFQNLVEKMVDNLGDQYDLNTTGAKNTISFPVDTMEDAIEMWQSFTQ